MRVEQVKKEAKGYLEDLDRVGTGTKRRLSLFSAVIL
jgi:hypothetical protein